MACIAESTALCTCEIVSPGSLSFGDLSMRTYDCGVLGRFLEAGYFCEATWSSRRGEHKWKRHDSR